MKNIAFVIWMVCWLPAISLSDYFDALSRGYPFPEDITGTACVITFCIWVTIAILLYEKE